MIDSLPHLRPFLSSLYDCRYAQFFQVRACWRGGQGVLPPPPPPPSPPPPPPLLLLRIWCGHNTVRSAALAPPGLGPGPAERSPAGSPHPSRPRAPRTPPHPIRRRWRG